MTKLVLNDIVDLKSVGATVTTINNNNAAIETALENTLSRNGASPNSMSSDLDMNSNDILNAGDIHTGTVTSTGNVSVGGNLTIDGVDVHAIVGLPGIQGPVGPPGLNGLVTSIVAGTNITVNSTNPSSPVISSSNNGAVYSSTRSNLANLSGISNPVVILEEAGRQGTFIWSSSNLSSKVSLDTQQGIYIAPSTDTSGTSGAWVRLTNGKVYAEWFGSIGDGTNLNTTAIQAALNFVSAGASTSVSTAPAYLDFGPGVFLSGTLTQPNRVIIRGSGISTTELKLANSTNASLLESSNFSSLTGQNKWLETDGVPVFIGLSDIRINGNKTNQSAGTTVSYYAKGLFFDKVSIFDGFSNCLYTECGNSPSVSTWSSFPEGNTNVLYISGAGSDGWVMRGPHDLRSISLVTLLNGGHGLNVQSSTTYAGSIDFDYIHSYANSGRGLYLNGTGFATVRVSMARLENNGQEGLYISTTPYCMFGSLHLFDNCTSSGSFQGVITVSSDFTVIGNLLSRFAGASTIGGLQVLSNENKVSGTILGDVSGGGNSSGIGLDLSGASFNNIYLNISGFSGAGGIGLRTNNTSAGSWNIVEVVLQNCATMWNNVASGSNNHYRITGDSLSGQTRLSGVGPAADTSKEIWNVSMWQTGSGQSFNSESNTTGTFAINSSAEQTITVNHNLIATPNLNDVQMSIVYAGAATDWVIAYLRLFSVSSTQIVAKVKLNTASATTANATVVFRSRL